MRLNFLPALQGLNSSNGQSNEGRNFAFRLANGARPPADYLLNTLLPEREMPDFDINQLGMTVYAIMAGLVGENAKPAGAALIKMTEMDEEVAKIGNHLKLDERNLKQLHKVIRGLRDRILDNGGSLSATNAATKKAIANEILNFTDKVLLQGQFDTMEFLRGQAISSGIINWTFNKKKLYVDYEIPTRNILTPRSGNDGYGGSASKWWTDVARAKRLVNLQVVLLHTLTYNMIIDNAANAIEVDDLGGTPTAKRFRLTKKVGTLEQRSRDARETIDVVAYQLEGNVIKEGTTDEAQSVPFYPTGKVSFIGSTLSREYRIGEGSTEDADNPLRLGYTHLAPTVEGDFEPGRWADVWSPRDRAFELHGEAITNGLPVIENKNKLVIGSTTMTADYEYSANI